MRKWTVIIVMLFGWGMLLTAQVPWHQIDITDKNLPWMEAQIKDKTTSWDEFEAMNKPLDWQRTDLETKDMYADIWHQVDLTGPEYKEKDRHCSPWWLLTPLVGVPLIILLDTDEEAAPVLPPDITCIDVTMEWEGTIPPADPSSVEVVNYCPEGTVTITQLEDVSNNGTGCTTDPLIISRTFQVMDECGNTTICVQQITLIDTQPPSIQVSATDATVECDGQGNTADIEGWLNNNGGASATDTHGDVSWSNDYTAGPGDCGESVMVNFTATDICGNAVNTSASFTITDETAPIITCPDDITISCEEGTDPAITGTATAVDNCTLPDQIAISYSDDDSGLTGCSGTGVLIRSWEAVDECGNASTCDQMITIIDDEAPVITCPDDITISCEEGTDPAITGTATAVDNCTLPDQIAISYSDDDSGLTGCSGTGVLIRSWEAVDECGNASTCDQAITIIDDEVARDHLPR
jgi:hypothetical protein